MTIASTQEFVLAAVAEDGRPISAGGPPLRALGQGEGVAEENGKFRVAAELGAGQSVNAGGPTPS